MNQTMLLVKVARLIRLIRLISVNSIHTFPSPFAPISSISICTMPFLVEEEGASGDMDAAPPLLPSPGKDPSRLLKDIIEHTFADPQIYTRLPYFDPTKPYQLPEPSHTHSWVMKHPDSLKSRPWNSHYEDSYLVACCETCRMHLSLTAIITSEEAPKCGTIETAIKTHHFHLESWTRNVRSSSSLPENSIKDKPELGSFQCCHCPFSVEIEFWQPVVPESVIMVINKRGMSNNPALNLLNRHREPKSSPSVTNAYATLATYVAHVLNGQAKDIQIHADSPFSRRVGTTPEILNFVSSLGWEIRDDHLVPPQWDEDLQKGRLRRKLLEHSEIELVQLALESGRGLENKEKVSMSLLLGVLMVDFEGRLLRAEPDMARLMSAPWPRPGIHHKTFI